MKSTNKIFSLKIYDSVLDNIKLDKKIDIQILFISFGSLFFLHRPNIYKSIRKNQPHLFRFTLEIYFLVSNLLN